MFNEDSLKIAQRALDAFMESEELTASEQQAAKKAYADLDDLIDGNAIASVWYIEDVKSLQEDEDEFTEEERITDDEARQVLKLADSEHDATVGINWDVLRAWLDYVRELAQKPDEAKKG